MKSGNTPVAGKVKEHTPSLNPIKAKTISDDKVSTKSPRVYSNKTLKILWGRAAGRCAMPTCRIDLFTIEPGYDPIWNMGEMGHIAGSSDAGPRGDESLNPKDRDEYVNLILLCRNCHGRVDGHEEAYPVERLKDIKAQHEAWVRHNLPERGLSTFGWSGLQLRGEFSFDAVSIGDAISPDYLANQTVLTARPRQSSWDEIKATLRLGVEELVDGADADHLRVAIFPLAPVSSCVFLGYVLTNRIRSQAFQYHRDLATWAWPKNTLEVDSPSLTVANQPREPNSEVCFVFSLSGTINLDSIQDKHRKTIYVFRLPSPSTSWLQQQSQLIDFGRQARQIFERAANDYPRSSKWHIYFSGPAPAAVVLGQQLNPTTTPPVQLYEFVENKHVASMLISCTDSRLGDWQHGTK